MNRGTYTITLILTGLLLGSLATIRTSIVPTRIQVVSNETEVRLSNSSTQATSSVEIEGKSLLPLHYDNGRFYFSETLSMDNLVQTDDETNRLKGGFNVSLTEQISNAKIKAELVLDGEDEVNSAIRVKLDYGQETVVLSQENSEHIFSAYHTQTKQMFYNIWYELEDENCTIENLNDAEGTDITIKLYVYVG